jgi:hypothetical protein
MALGNAPCTIRPQHGTTQIRMAWMQCIIDSVGIPGLDHFIIKICKEFWSIHELRVDQFDPV